MVWYGAEWGRRTKLRCKQFEGEYRNAGRNSLQKSRRVRKETVCRRVAECRKKQLQERSRDYGKRGQAIAAADN